MNVFIWTVCFYITVPTASAQFNLNKVKEAVKKELPTKEQIKGQAETDVQKKVEAEAEQVQAAESKKTLKPSAEAIAKDPAAGDNKVKEGYSKSPAEIRAGYEALNPEWYFIPYYHPYLKNWYLTDQESEKRFLDDVQTIDTHVRQGRNFVRLSEKTSDGNQIRFLLVSGDLFQYYKFRQETIPGGNTEFRIYDDLPCYMPIGISAAFAGFALFTADPEGLIPFMRFCEAKNAVDGYAAVAWTGLDPEPRMARDWTKVRLNSNGDVGTLPFEENKVRDRLQSTVATDLVRMASEVTPLAVIQKAAEHYLGEIKKYEPANNYGMMRYNLHVLEQALYVWGRHDKSDYGEANYKRIIGEFDKYASRYEKWKEQEMMGGNAVAMPKTFDMGAALANKALEAAKKQMTGSFTVDKVVFLSNTWKEYKEPDYPYRVTLRAIDAALLTNDNGNWVMRQYYFRQHSDMQGGWKEEYSFQAMGSSNPQRVDYK